MPPRLYPVYALPICHSIQQIYIFLKFILQYIYTFFFTCLYFAHSPPLPTNIYFEKTSTAVYIYIFVFLTIFYSAYPYLYTKNKVNAAVYTCPVCRSRQVCPVFIAPSLWPAYTLPIPHPCQQIYFFFRFHTVVYIYTFFVDNILPCISILRYKKINAAVYTCRDYLRYHASWEPSPTNIYF